VGAHDSLARYDATPLVFYRHLARINLVLRLTLGNADELGNPCDAPNQIVNQGALTLVLGSFHSRTPFIIAVPRK
jgi:hypothetical protein